MGKMDGRVLYSVIVLGFLMVFITYYNNIITLKNVVIPFQEIIVSTSRRKNSLEDLSEIVQNQLAQLQNPSLTARNCSVPTIYCVHVEICGLGCQIVHRIACLMVSYAYNMPLIHDEYHGWTYSKRWNDVFYPLGSPCTPGPLTRYLSGLQHRVPAELNVSSENIQNYRFYLPNGIPVPKNLADEVELLHPEPFYWWVGQFMKYGLRLLPAEAELVREAQRAIKFSHPIVGIHVRRTDKIGEQPEGFHDVKDYFAVAEEYYQNLTLQGVSFSVKRVFLATDDQSVIVEVNKKYQPPDWEVISFNNTRNMTWQTQRAEFMDEIVTDLFTLAESDFVVCAHTSNICGVLWGISYFRHAPGPQTIKGFDPYRYGLQGNPYHYIPNKIVKT